MGLHKDCCFSMIPQKWAGNLLGDITASVDVPIQRYQKQTHIQCLCAWILTMILTILMSFYRDAMVRQIQASLYMSVLTLTTLEVHIKSCLTWELVLKSSLVTFVFFVLNLQGRVLFKAPLLLLFLWPWTKNLSVCLTSQEMSWAICPV